MNTTLRLSTLPAAVLALALFVTACGGPNDSGATQPGHDMGSMSTTPTPSASSVGTPAAGAHNEADVTFATAMIPHHAQAIAMADMATSKATNAEVRDLASTIKAAQAPEIAQMSGWLTGWGEPVPDPAGASGMAMGDGMMSDAEMTKLHEADGTAFDRMWLQMMIKHHQGAVAMAATEVKSGSNADAKNLAQSIMTSQKAEIVKMQQLETSVG